jgi:F-type H+-transporting ATPase subunit delta
VTLKTIARRYAAALFDVTSRNRTEEQAGRDIAAVVALIQGHDGLQRALETPAVPAQRKKAVIEAVMAAAGAIGTGSQVGDETRRMIVMLAERDRLAILPDVAALFAERLMAAKKIVPAEVVTAVPLPEKSRAAMAQALGRATGAEVTITARVDPAIVGGVIATVGSRVYDGSVAGQLDRLKKKLVADA